MKLWMKGIMEMWRKMMIQVKHQQFKMKRRVKITMKLLTIVVKTVPVMNIQLWFNNII